MSAPSPTSPLKSPTAEKETWLKETIYKLPLSILGKVELWLAYKNIKPVSTITIEGGVPVSKADPKLQDLIAWLKVAGLYSTASKKDKGIYAVSKGRSYSKETAKIIHSNNFKDTVRKAELFGYPLEASREFAEQFSQYVKEKKLTEKWSFVALKAKGRKLFSHYWLPYVRYSVRNDHIYEDSLIAKSWADEIRNQLPKLAKEFEDKIGKAA